MVEADSSQAEWLCSQTVSYKLPVWTAGLPLSQLSGGAQLSTEELFSTLSFRVF